MSPEEFLKRSAALDDRADERWFRLDDNGHRHRHASSTAPLLAEILLPTDGHVGHEHDAGVTLEQRPQPGQDRLHFFLWQHRHDHHQALQLAEHEMAFVKAMMAFAGDIADDGVAARLNLVQQLRHKRAVLTRNDHSDFFHRMQRQPAHNQHSFHYAARGQTPNGTGSVPGHAAPLAYRQIPVQGAFLPLHGDQVDPPIVIEPLQNLMAMNEGLDARARRLDECQQACGLMVRDLPIHHGLPGQSRSEVALHLGHDADPAHHVVIDLAPAAVPVVVHGRKIVLHGYPLGHYLRGGHDDLQQPAD